MPAGRKHWRGEEAAASLNVSPRRGELLLGWGIWRVCFGAAFRCLAVGILVACFYRRSSLEELSAMAGKGRWRGPRARILLKRSAKSALTPLWLASACSRGAVICSLRAAGPRTRDNRT